MFYVRLCFDDLSFYLNLYIMPNDEQLTHLWGLLPLNTFLKHCKTPTKRIVLETESQFDTFLCATGANKMIRIKIEYLFYCLNCKASYIC